MSCVFSKHLSFLFLVQNMLVVNVGEIKVKFTDWLCKY